MIYVKPLLEVANGGSELCVVNDPEPVTPIWSFPYKSNRVEVVNDIKSSLASL